MAATGVSLSVMKNAYISLIIGPRGLVCKPTYRKSWAGNLLMWSDLTLGPSFKVKQGEPNLKVPQIRRIVSSLQNLDWEYFWPHFEKQDGRHGRFFVSHEKCLYLPYYWS